MTVVGTLISDMLLMWIEPRLRLTGGPDMKRVHPMSGTLADDSLASADSCG